MIAGDFYFYYWKIDSLFCLFLETAFLLFALAQCTPLCFAIFFGLANLDTNVEATDTVPDGVVNFKRQLAAVEALVHKPHTYKKTFTVKATVASTIDQVPNLSQSVVA